MGVSLSQLDDDGNEYAVEDRSKSFSKHERNMPITEKEMASIIFGVKELRHFLIVREFEIVTDNSALTYRILLNIDAALISESAYKCCT